MARPGRLRQPMGARSAAAPWKCAWWGANGARPGRGRRFISCQGRRWRQPRGAGSLGSSRVPAQHGRAGRWPRRLRALHARRGAGAARVALPAGAAQHGGPRGGLRSRGAGASAVRGRAAGQAGAAGAGAARWREPPRLRLRGGRGRSLRGDGAAHPPGRAQPQEGGTVRSRCGAGARAVPGRGGDRPSLLRRHHGAPPGPAAPPRLRPAGARSAAMVSASASRDSSRSFAAAWAPVAEPHPSLGSPRSGVGVRHRRRSFRPRTDLRGAPGCGRAAGGATGAGGPHPVPARGSVPLRWTSCLQPLYGPRVLSGYSYSARLGCSQDPLCILPTRKVVWQALKCHPSIHFLEEQSRKSSSLPIFRLQDCCADCSSLC